jgi:hypothetical protein
MAVCSDNQAAGIEVYVDEARLRLWSWPPTGLLFIQSMIYKDGAKVEWYRQRKSEKLVEKPVSVPLCPPQLSDGITRRRFSKQMVFYIQLPLLLVWRMCVVMCSSRSAVGEEQFMVRPSVAFLLRSYSSEKLLGRNGNSWYPGKHPHMTFWWKM